MWRGPAAIGLVHDRTTTARTPDNLLFGFGRGRLRPERGFDEKLNFEKIVFSGAFCDQVNAVELVDATVLFYLSREQRCKFAATWFLKNILRPMQILKIPRPIPLGSNSGCFGLFNMNVALPHICRYLKWQNRRLSVCCNSSFSSDIRTFLTVILIWAQIISIRSLNYLPITSGFEMLGTMSPTVMHTIIN